MILTGRPDTRLSAEAHAKVHAAAAELGYRPNVAARALRTDQSRSIAFISDYVATTRFASGLIRGALAAADAAKNVLLVLETGGEPARTLRAIEAALDRQVDGVILAAMRAREVFLPDITISVPTVMLNGTNARLPISVLPTSSKVAEPPSASLPKRGSPTASFCSGTTPKRSAGSSAPSRFLGASPAFAPRWRRRA